MAPIYTHRVITKQKYSWGACYYSAFRKFGNYISNKLQINSMLFDIITV